MDTALNRIEGNLLLREGITLVAHFKELNAYTKTQEVSKILTFVNKIKSNNNIIGKEKCLFLIILL